MQFYKLLYVCLLQHNLGVQHREGAQVPVLCQQGNRVHDGPSGRLQRIRRHNPIVVRHFNYLLQY